MQTSNPKPTGAPQGRGKYWNWLVALLPLVLLGAVLVVFVKTDGAGLQVEPVAPIEQLEFERVVVKDREIDAYVRNSSRNPLKVAAIFVNDAVVEATAYPSDEIPRLGQGVVRIYHHWVRAEPLRIKLLSANGIPFEHEVPAAGLTPEPGVRTFFSFLLIGLYVGIVPVGLGVLWYPFLRRLGRLGTQFVLALTVGLLAFLAVDTVEGAFEFSSKVPGAFQGTVLIVVFTLLSLLVLVAASQRPSNHPEGHTIAARRRRVAYYIALGIGLHNLGEGLAIGTAYAAGEAALGTFLVVGFTLHNFTEGVGIVSPLTEHTPPLKHFFFLAALAGLPAIVGTWIGGFVTNPMLSTIFFAIGAGAILQVIYEVGKLIVEQSKRDGRTSLSWLNLGGLTAGLALMWVTALLV